MSSRPMLTLLNARLQGCYVNGTKVHESGLTVSTEKFPGETILFFHTDSHEGRKSLNMVQEGVKICDYLVFYMKDNGNTEIVCFLELKGRNLVDAVKQVLSTRERVVTLVNEEIDRRHHPYITWRACICLHGSAPRNRQSALDELLKFFDKNNIHIRYGRTQYQFLGDFLRTQVR